MSERRNRVHKNHISFSLSLCLCLCLLSSPISCFLREFTKLCFFLLHSLDTSCWYYIICIYTHFTLWTHHVDIYNMYIHTHGNGNGNGNGTTALPPQSPKNYMDTCFWVSCACPILCATPCGLSKTDSQISWKSLSKSISFFSLSLYPSI